LRKRFLGVSVAPEAHRVLNRMHRLLKKNQVKCNRSQACEYALAYVEMALDQKIDIVDMVLRNRGSE